MQPHSLQTFFLPQQFSEKASTLRAEIYNLAQTLLKRTPSRHVFVPIRSMQYLAIIDGPDIWFVDSQAYAVNGNEGGRMITVSWHIEPTDDRDSLVQHLPLRIVFYDMDMSEIQLRLSGEFLQAMQQMDQRYRDSQIPGEGARIVAFRKSPQTPDH